MFKIQIGLPYLDGFISQVCDDYLSLTVSGEPKKCNSLDRKNLKKVRRRRSQVKSLPDSADRQISASILESMASGIDLDGPSSLE